jgi:N-acetylglucosaminyldiphosphoundecaprenol N-acetyl-beta-D-mannosaminyltransferase
MQDIVHQDLVINAQRLQFIGGSFDSVLQFLLSNRKKASKIILPTSLNDLAKITSSEYFAEAYKAVDYHTTDGMPLVWWLRRKTQKKIERVYGPDIIQSLIHNQDIKRQCLLCPSKEVRKLLTAKFANEIAKKKVILEVVGSIEDKKEKERLVKIVNEYKPEVTWIGIGSPNQVLLASYLSKKVKHKCLYMCVGAAVPFLAGTVPQAPKWMRSAGLEWLFRLTKEPKRLWRRYLIDLPTFLIKTTLSGSIK